MLSLTFGNPSTCTVPLMHWSCHFFHGFCCISPALFCPYYCLAFPRFPTSSPDDFRIRFVSHTRHVHYNVHYGSTSSSPPAIFGARQRTSNSKLLNFHFWAYEQISWSTRIMASPWARPAFKGKGRDSSPFTLRQSLNYSSFLGDSVKRFVGMYKAQPTHFLSIALASFFLAKKKKQWQNK